MKMLDLHAKSNMIGPLCMIGETVENSFETVFSTNENDTRAHPEGE